MHVTLVTPAFAHPERADFPGIRRHSGELVKALLSKGIQVRVVTPEIDGTDDAFGGNIEIIRLPTSYVATGRAGNVAQARILAFGKRFSRTPGLLEGTEVIHADIPLLGIDTIRKRRPVVATGFHLEQTRSALDLLSVPFGNSYGSYTFRHADAVVALSEAAALQLGRRFGISWEKVHVIHPGIDRSKFYASGSRNGRGPNSRTRRILFVGPMSRRKNVILLLQAYEVLAQSHVDVQLVLVGSGPLDKKIDRMIRLHSLEGRVLRMRNLDDSKLREAYENADVYASPSLDEGFGFSVVEAMACRTPVVVLDRPVSREVVADAGILVPDSSIQSWVVALKRLVEDTALADDLSQRGWTRVRNMYSWDEAADKYARLYERLAGDDLTS